MTEINEIQTMTTPKGVYNSFPDLTARTEIEELKKNGTGNGSGQNVPHGDVFGGYDRFYDNIARMQVNPTVPLNIQTYDGSNKPTHPKVLHFENGWAGHKYWLTYSPFPNNNNGYENPCIAYSEDGINWTSDGISNPIEDVPREGYAAVGYNSDPHLVIANGVMECWWRTHYKSGTNAVSEVIYRKTSVDGIHWGEREELFRSTDPVVISVLSPSAIYEDGIYKIWTVYKQETMRYYESATGADWTHIRDINVDNPDYPAYKLWHIDVIHTDKGYEFVGCYHPTDNYDDNRYIYYAISQDNITYSNRVLILTPGPAGNFDATELYRPAILRLDNMVRVYYGCRNGSGNWKIGMIEAPNPYLFNAVLRNGRRFAILEERLAALESGSGGSGGTDAPTGSHAIAYRLTNCASSNGATSVSDGAAYSTTITANAGHTLGALAVSMGGADITATAWNPGTATVTIPAVTGDVTISCTATANPAAPEPEIEQIPIGNITWSIGGINPDTGADMTTPEQVGSSPFTVNEYAGQTLTIVFDANPFDYSQKVVFYDAGSNRVGAVYGKSQKIVAKVPDNAVYARLSSAVDGFTSAQVLGCQLSEMSTVETLSGQYYNADDGAVKSDVVIDAVKVSTGDVDFAVINGDAAKIVSCAAYNSDNAFVRGLTFYAKVGQRHIDLDGCAYLGLNYDKGANNLYYRGVTLGQLIGETAYPG